MKVRLSLAVLATLVVGCYDGPGDQGEPWAGADGSTGTIPSGDSSPGSTTSGGSDGSASSTQGSATASASASSSATSDSTTDPTDPTTDGSTGADTGGTSGNMVPDGVSPEEAELVELINGYRMDNGLPAVPLCPSLALVARTHCVDQVEEAPQSVGNCNLHSWSDAGDWTACCYTPDHAQAQCMWDKPREISVYTGNGYEISVGGGGSITPAGALAAWQSSAPHNDVILNQDIWADHPWACIGAGLYMGYSNVWFGEETDPAQ